MDEARLPPLATDPLYGRFPWWPEDGDAWVHPEDVAAARRTIPGPRVWRRDGTHGEFVVLHYGAERLRVRPRLWVEAPHEGLDVGDLVEVLPHGLTNDPFTGHVREVHWDDHREGLVYYLTTAAGAPHDHPFTAEDLKHVEAPHPQEESRLKPRPDDGEELGVEEE